MTTSKLIIDCDPGHDDAAAILYAARNLDLLGLTTTYGNQSLDKTTRNALRICALGGLDLPVAGGADRPWVAAQEAVPEAHGKSGIDGADLPDSDRSPIPQHAVDFIIQQAHRHRGDLIVAAIGPMTNLATALRAEPQLASWLKGVTVMGGSTTLGNITPVAEVNIHADPEAAHAVFNSGVPLWLTGLNVTRRVGIGISDISRLEASSKRVARTFSGLFDFYRSSLNALYGLDTASLHDPCALMPLIDHRLVTYRPMHVDIELHGSLTRGMTVVDARYVGNDNRPVRGTGTIRPGRAHNALVAIDVDERAAVSAVLEALLSYD